MSHLFLKNGWLECCINTLSNHRHITYNELSVYPRSCCFFIMFRDSRGTQMNARCDNWNTLFQFVRNIMCSRGSTLLVCKSNFNHSQYYSFANMIFSKWTFASTPYGNIADFISDKTVSIYASYNEVIVICLLTFLSIFRKWLQTSLYLLVNLQMNISECAVLFRKFPFIAKQHWRISFVILLHPTPSWTVYLLSTLFHYIAYICVKINGFNLKSNPRNATSAWSDSRPSRALVFRKFA